MGGVLIGTCVVLLLVWIGVFCYYKARIAAGAVPDTGNGINVQMAYIYFANATFLFSAEMFSWAPNIRYWNIFPFILLAVTALQLERLFSTKQNDWGFAFCCVPICFLAFSAREVHLMISGFCFSAMEFVYNAPPNLDRAMHHLTIFSVLYCITVMTMEYFYGNLESALEPAPDWRVEFCFLAFIVPFRAPILWKRRCEAARAADLAKLKNADAAEQTESVVIGVGVSTSPTDVAMNQIREHTKSLISTLKAASTKKQDTTMTSIGHALERWLKMDLVSGEIFDIGQM